MTVKKEKMPFEDDSELWENGTYGESAEHAAAAPAGLDKTIDDGLGLEMISIRLQKSLIADLKALAVSQGLTYQPMVRQILTKYVQNQKRKIREAVRR